MGTCSIDTIFPGLETVTCARSSQYIKKKRNISKPLSKGKTNSAHLRAESNILSHKRTYTHIARIVYMTCYKICV